MYVADNGNNAIRKVTATGMVTSWLDYGSAAPFNCPSGVAVDRTGNVYVADTGNNTIRKVSAAGMVTTLAGNAEEADSADGNGTAARFREPVGVAVDGKGNLYVADSKNHTIRKVSAAGFVTTLAGRVSAPDPYQLHLSRHKTHHRPGGAGHTDGTGSAARFDNPSGVAVGRAGNLYVADTDNATNRKVSPDGVVTTLAGSARRTGYADGQGCAARLMFPYGVAVDTTSNLYVADGPQPPDPGKIESRRRSDDAGGQCSHHKRGCCRGRLCRWHGQFRAVRFPASGVAVDRAGNVYVTELYDFTIRKVSPVGVVTTLAGSTGQRGCADGTGQRGAVYRSSGRGGESRGQRVRGGLWELHHSQGDSGGSGDDVGGQRLNRGYEWKHSGRMCRWQGQCRPVSPVRLASRWTAGATCS